MKGNKWQKKYKALCDPNRLWILNILQNGEYCSCKLLEILDISQSTLSHHMRILVDAEVVHARKDGKWMRYSLSDKGILCLQKYLESFRNCS